MREFGKVTIVIRGIVDRKLWPRSRIKAACFFLFFFFFNRKCLTVERKDQLYSLRAFVNGYLINSFGIDKSYSSFLSRILYAESTCELPRKGLLIQSGNVLIYR